MRAPCRESAGRADERSFRSAGRGGRHLPRVIAPEFNGIMSDRDDFLHWFETVWRSAELALHNGDAGPRFETWSERDSVTLFGAWLSAVGPVSVRDVFRKLERTFSDATSSEIELIAADVSGDMAYTAHRELTSTSVNGEPRDYVLRVTQVYRHEDDKWQVVHRHADPEPEATEGT